MEANLAPTWLLCGIAGVAAFLCYAGAWVVLDLLTPYEPVSNRAIYLFGLLGSAGLAWVLFSSTEENAYPASVDWWMTATYLVVFYLFAILLHWIERDARLS